MFFSPPAAGHSAFDQSLLPPMPDGVTVTVMILALNEEKNLPYILPRIPAWVHEVLLVDGYSKDRTVAVARELLPDIRVVYQDGKGKGAAIRSGFRAATGDIVVHLDADGSTNPDEIPAFVGALLGGADFAKGSRFLQGAGTDDMPLYRKMGNWGFVVLSNLLFRTKYTDITYGYNATWRHQASAMALEIDGWANEIISNIRVARHGLKVVEVACFECERIAGEAKLATFSAGWTILKGILRERFTRLNDIPIVPLLQETEHPMYFVEPDLKTAAFYFQKWSEKAALEG